MRWLTASLFLTAVAAPVIAFGWLGGSTPSAPSPAEPPAAPASEAERPLVQLALLLDTSSSMNGLIDQARSQLWSVVNELAEAKRDGRTPKLEIALYEYGNDGLPAEGGWVRQVLPFTTELDAVSEQLFALSTNGGTEEAPRAVVRAVEDLGWDRAEDTLRIVFVAGNERFDQGPVSPSEAAAAAGRAGIVVNTIFCGSARDGTAATWRQPAQLASGSFFTLDHNQALAHIQTPYDARLEALNIELNETYLPYGQRGRRAHERQRRQDANAKKMGKLSSRAASKGGKMYSNAGWDLVDALDRKKVRLEALGEDQLPPALRGKSDREKRAYVAKKRKERKALQAQIAELAKKRKAAEAEERRRRRLDERPIDRMMVEALREQGVKVGLRFE